MTIKAGRLNSGSFEDLAYEPSEELGASSHQTSRALLSNGESPHFQRRTSSRESTSRRPSLIQVEQGDSDSDSESKSKETSKEAKHSPVCADGAAVYLQRTLGELLLGSKMNILLLFTPFAFLGKALSWNPEYTFSFALMALVPFAERVSFVTEDVAKYTNGTLGGLLNATFGNITEMVICFFALQKSLIRVVQVSMLGSVLSNLLLVLGSAFLVGGIRHKEQSFNRTAAVTNSGLLIIAVLALSLPSVLDATHSGSGEVHKVAVVRPPKVSRSLLSLQAVLPQQQGSPGLRLNETRGLQGGKVILPPLPSWVYGNGTLETETEGGDAPLWLSRFIAAVLLLLYGMLIFFQLSTHRYMFEGEEDDDDEEPGLLGFWGGVFWLAIITFFISTLSDMIVDTIEGAAANMGTPLLFLSGILVPIVGNAAEHAAAVIFAWKNKMEICLGSAVGSAVQISLLVIPLCVMVGWAVDQPMTMNFHIFETAVLLIACIGSCFILMDGRSHWLKGVILIASYVMIAAAFWAHADPDNMS